MKLSPAQRSLLLAMHGGANVEFGEDDRVFHGDKVVTKTVMAMGARKLICASGAADDPDGRLTLTPAGRELAEKIKEQA